MRALGPARGKAKMAILGHPLYAGGLSTVGDSAEFAALGALLREHDVSIVMAGDTHDLEYYAERPDGSARTAPCGACRSPPPTSIRRSWTSASSR